ncbi:protein translocase subunit SECA2, chloroplastic-like [Fagus crenata]
MEWNMQLTGRVEEKRRWSEGIHQAVEAKEGLKIQLSWHKSHINHSLSFTQTVRDDWDCKNRSMDINVDSDIENEFLKMFQIPVIEVPTNLPNIRNDLPIQAFAIARGKWEHVCREVAYMFRLCRPVLVGTTSMLMFLAVALVCEEEGGRGLKCSKMY